MKRLKNLLKRFYLRNIYYPYIWKFALFLKVHKLRQKDRITIAFVTMNVAMWKYQALYQLLQKNKRFNLYIVISPSVKFSKEEMCNNAQQMRDFFRANNMEFIDWDIENDAPPVDIRKTLNPDILFYTQPGLKAFTPQHAFQNFRDKLICYTPYGFLTLNNAHIYNRPFLNNAWKIFYATKTQCDLAKKFANNKGINAVFAGYASYDSFIKENKVNTWKIKDENIKKIIWAPHFTITKSLIKGFAPRSNFLWMADLMINLAEQYKDMIQIAFKPHPRLLTELYNHPDWGKKKADEYYKKWEKLPNGQLETGGFINLFHFSDALIHDSGSFVMDYMYFNQPQMFITKDINIQKQESDDLALLVFNNLYVGCKKEDIIRFINEIIIDGNDYKAKDRQRIKEDYLLPPNRKLASENMYEDLCKSLGVQC